MTIDLIKLIKIAEKEAYEIELSEERNVRDICEQISKGTYSVVGHESELVLAIKQYNEAFTYWQGLYELKEKALKALQETPAPATVQKEQ